MYVKSETCITVSTRVALRPTRPLVGDAPKYRGRLAFSGTIIMEDVAEFSDEKGADDNSTDNISNTEIGDEKTIPYNNRKDRIQLSRVSRAFHNLIFTSAFWYEVTLYNTRGFGEDALELLKGVNFLDASVNKLDDEFVRKLVMGPPGKSLRGLDLSGNDITDTAITHIGYNCTHLQKLSLKGCHNISRIQPLGLLSAHLNTLILSHCGDIWDTSFDGLVEQLGPNLSKLDLDGCYNLTHECVVKISRHLTNLRYLAIDGQGIGDPTLIEIFENCKSLELFSMSFCDSLTDESLVAICHNIAELSLGQMVQPEIRWISLDWCWGIKEECLLRMLTLCPKLQEISMEGCFEITCESLEGRKFPELKVLNLFSCRGVDSSTIKKICQLNKEIYIIDYYGEAYRDGRRIGYRADVYVEGEGTGWGMLNVGNNLRFYRGYTV
ncbi:2672_t:CDS:2 [Acaulospora colombiana]|uniref:2672_t:CDS:1 n=1 Tax=Acaulospora colombiana TaxID=27376 RepID=A0ACA9K3B0_9GLOM|nr:2672_t:CDS:2 [Acaulospora colombiana]